jgi:PAS domain S-box-containing protein
VRTDGARSTHGHAPGFDAAQLQRSLVEQHFVGIAQADAQGILRFVNERWCAMLGYRADELLGMSLADLTDPGCLHDQHAAIARLSTRAEDGVIDQRYRCHDGTLLHATTSFSAIRDDEGHYQGFIALAVDNTRRVRAEALQADLRRALELVARAAPLPETLAALIRTAEQHSAHGMAGEILLSSGGSLRHVAAGSLPAMLQSRLHEVQLPVPADAEHARRVEVMRDPHWAPLRETALAHGWHACWTQPIAGSHGQLLGVFVLYYRRRCRPRQDDCAMVDLVLRTAALAIERAQGEHALHEREEHLRVALDTGRLGEWSLDLRTLALRSNAMAKAHYGLGPDAPLDFEVLMRDFIHPDDREKLRTVVREALRRHLHEFDLEHRAVWRDGSVHWIHTRGRVSRDAGGRAAKLTGVCQDMTERRSAEEALRERTRALRASESRLRNLANITPALLWSALPDGRMTYVSDRWYEYTGVPRNDNIDWIALLHPDDLEPTRRAWQEAVVGQHEFEAELRMRGRDGSYRWFLARAVPLRDEDGEATCWFGASTDIEDQRRVVQALRVSEQRASLAMDLAKVSTWSWNPRDNRITGDARWYAMLGVDPDVDLDLERIGRRIHHRDWPRVEAGLLSTLEPGSDGTFSEEYRWLHRDGSTRWATVRGQMLYRDAPEGRQPLRMIGSAIDVTNRRNTEEALRDADRRKDEFLATLAHELRNPLAPLRTSLHILRMDVGEADRHRLHAVMERQVTQLVRLVDDLLEVSRITRGKIALHKERVAVADIVDQAVETSRPLLDSAHHQLALDLPPEPLHLDADPVRVAQVLSNLLNNAAKYTEPGGRIVLSARREGDDVVLRVQDNGAGIPPDQIAHVFDLFSQADRTLHRAQGGLGIGLTLVRQLVELHGGSVRAQSAGVGQGSCFEVRLPASDAATGESPSRSNAPAAAAHQCRVLVVDDNREHTDALALFLRIAGHDVRGAYDAAHALAEAATFTPEAVLLDVGLPDMDGFELCRRLRAQTGGEERVLVAITGWGQADDRRRSQAAGFDAHLVKPVDPDALLALVDALCRARHAEHHETIGAARREAAARIGGRAS